MKGNATISLRKGLGNLGFLIILLLIFTIVSSCLPPSPEEARGKIADWHAKKGFELLGKKEFEKAEKEFTKAMEYKPDFFLAYHGRCGARIETGRLDEAMEDAEKMIEMNPRNEISYLSRAYVFRKKGNMEETKANLERCVEINDKQSGCLNDLAWLLATSSQDSMRDGVRAVEMAKRACEITKWQNAAVVDTLAAAYAEIGDFQKAVEYQSKAVPMQMTEHAEGAKERLEMYKAGEKYRE